MNQILDHSGPKKRTATNVAAQGKPLTDINKIIKFFAIVILIFGVCLVGNGVFGIKENSNKNKQIAITEPIITATRDGDYITVVVKHDKAISQITYRWDEKDAEVVQGNGQEEIHINKIGVSNGEHTLYVTATDGNGVTSVFEEKYTSDNGVDTTEPTINIQTGSPIVITAEDDVALSYITISIEGQDEIRVNAGENGGDPKKIVYEMNVDADSTAFVVSAVDRSNNEAVQNNTNVYVRPKIVFAAKEDYSQVYVTTSSEFGIKRVEYTLNGGEVVGKDFDESEIQKEITFVINTVEGENEIVVRSYPDKEVYENADGTGKNLMVAEETATCTYNP